MKFRLTPRRFLVLSAACWAVAGGAGGCGEAAPGLFESPRTAAVPGTSALGGAMSAGGSGSVSGGVNGVGAGASGGGPAPIGGPSMGGFASNSGGRADGGGTASGGAPIGGPLGGGPGAGGGISNSGGQTSNSGGQSGQTSNSGGRPAEGGCVAAKAWSADFTGDPTLLDGNADDSQDWRLRNGDPFTTGELSGGVWRAPPHQVLDTAPVNDFQNRVVVEVRMRHIGSSDDAIPAIFWINVDSASPRYVSIGVALRKVNASQSLRLFTLDAMSEPQELFALDGLPDELTDLRLDISPAERQVSLAVNGVARGTFQAIQGLAEPKDPYATLWSGSGGAEFDSVSVTLCAP